VSAALVRVSNRHHTLVRECRLLARGVRDGRVLLDGAHLVGEALRAGATLEAVLATGAALAASGDLGEALRAAGVPVYDASESVLDAASPTRTPSGIVAIARWGTAEISRLFRPDPALVVGLVDVQDPGNVGAVIRAADALGATGVASVGQSADPGGWKALRGSMGSAFRLPVARTDWAPLLEAARQGATRVVAAVAHGGVPASEAHLDRPTLLLVGHEGAGLSEAVLEQADERVSLAMRPGVDSLNVSIATALLLDAARRARAPRAPSVARKAGLA
jgi:TrmH family RNA methyltransferase